MDIQRIVADAKAELELLNEAIDALERLGRQGTRRRGRPPVWLQELTVKPRGRPPGSRNKKKRK